MTAVAWLLANWRLAAFIAITAALAMQTIRLQESELDVERITADFKAFVAATRAAGEEAVRMREAIEAHHEMIQEELNHDVATQAEHRARERAERSDRFAALYRRYGGMLNDPGPGADRGGMPETRASAAAALHARGSTCLDAERLVASLRRHLDTFHRELEPLLGRGEDGLDDSTHWAQWARLTGACAAPPAVSGSNRLSPDAARTSPGVPGSTGEPGEK